MEKIKISANNGLWLRSRTSTVKKIWVRQNQNFAFSRPISNPKVPNNGYLRALSHFRPPSCTYDVKLSQKWKLALIFDKSRLVICYFWRSGLWQPSCLSPWYWFCCFWKWSWYFSRHYRVGRIHTEPSN